MKNFQHLVRVFWSKLQRQEFIEFGLQSLILQYRIKDLEENPDLNLKLETAQKLSNLEELID